MVRNWRGTPRNASHGSPALCTDALLLDAGMKQTLTVARSLGRAGLGVSVAECANDEPGSPPAFWSRWAQSSTFLPDFGEDPDLYAAHVLDMVKRHPVSVIFPASDQSIASLRPWRAQIERHARLALASEPALDIAVDKSQTLRLAGELGIPAPRTIAVDCPGDLAGALSEVGYPAVVKPETSWRRERGGQRLIPREVLNHKEAAEAIEDLGLAGVAALVQELAVGRRETICMFRADGKISAEFAHAAMRTTPMLGGAFVLRESIAMPAELRSMALSLVDAIGLDGYSEVEFRRDGRGRPLLMEINARLSGSIEHAARSGVDFPLMVWQWSSGRPVERSRGYQCGVRLRWLTGDARWLVETIRRPGRPDSVPAGRALATFVAEFARRDYYDLFDLGDPLPAVAEIGRVAEKAIARMANKLKANGRYKSRRPHPGTTTGGSCRDN
jgi:predicted ATP-grasp superfamily ATP-dependent carboligase